MRFKAKKVYGQSKSAECPFCGKIATAKNEQGLDVCRFHVKTKLEEIKCVCGSWLEQRVGKFGPYFNCLNCGNINYKKGMEMKGMDHNKSIQKPVEKPLRYNKKPKPKEITITTDDLEYFS